MSTRGDICFLQLLCICDYLDICAVKIELGSNVIRSAYPSIIIRNATATRTMRRQIRLFSVAIKVSEYWIAFNRL